ncbi:MAG: tetratricopeptide repeat protein [Woeseiaceae bacterium]|nr:tetratricopeptide repeat protein [Woeseiaceae bacterium]
MAASNGSSRRRGVIASRQKLNAALTMAGLKTQAALAERIAEFEGLDNAPRDAVNRAFREQAVDPQTLERIAQALNVEAWTLYRTAAEAAVLPSPAPASRVRARLAAGAALLTVVVLGAAWWLVRDDDTPTQAAGGREPTVVTALDLGTPTLVVMPFAGDEDDRLGRALRAALADTFSVATDTANVLAGSLDSAAVAGKLRADVVVDGEVVRVGRMSGVRLYLFARGVRQQVWGESQPLVALQAASDALVQRLGLAVRRATGFPVPEGALPPHFPLARVQDDYLEGEMHLDAPSNELNVKRAETRFEAALRQDANYARAHAGLCQALLEEHWMSDEERALRDAGRACGQAVQLDPGDPVVAAAHAHYLRRTGRNEEAVRRYEQIVADHPLYASAWHGLGSSLLHAYRQTGDEALLERAKAAARRSADVDPEIWKPLFALGTMEYFDGDVVAAIAATEGALARDENEYVAANLGTFYLCDGGYEEAIEAYTLARELAPGSYVGDEFLGMARYFTGDFEASARLRERAIESISTGEPEIHEMWGNLGDSYRQLGRRADAIAAYLRAAEIAERDHLRGTAPAADRAARAYYYTMLGTLDPGLVPAAVEQAIAAELDAIDAALVSASAQRRMAQTWLSRGDEDKARAALDRATATCRGYGGLPDLVALTR